VFATRRASAVTRTGTEIQRHEAPGLFQPHSCPWISVPVAPRAPRRADTGSRGLARDAEPHRRRSSAPSARSAACFLDRRSAPSARSRLVFRDRGSRSSARSAACLSWPRARAGRAIAACLSWPRIRAVREIRGLSCPACSAASARARRW